MTNKRAPRGSGSVRQLPSGMWQATVTLGKDAGGKQQRESRPFPTKTAAEKWRRQRAAEVQQGARTKTTRETTGQYLDRWIETVKAGLEANTYRSYASHVRLYLKPAFGAVPLADLTGGHISKMYRDLAARKLSATTIRSVRSTLRRALNQAVDWGDLTRNVVKKASAALPKAKKYKPNPMTLEEVRRFLASTQAHRLAPFWRTALATGMRFGELAALHWESVRLDAAMLVVERSLERPPGGGTRLKETKTDRSRTLDLDADTVTALREWQSRQRFEKQALGAAWAGNGHVFTATNGAPLHGSNLWRRFQSDLKRAGVGKRRFQDLRHTHATLMLADGAPLKDVSERLGHASVKITLDTYATAMKTTGQRIAQQFGELLGS